MREAQGEALAPAPRAEDCSADRQDHLRIFPAALPPRAINAFVPLCRSQVAVASAFVPPPPIPTFLTPTRVHDLKNALSHGTFCSILKGAQPMTETTAPLTSPEPIKVAAMDRLEPYLRANVAARSPAATSPSP